MLPAEELPEDLKIAKREHDFIAERYLSEYRMSYYNMKVNN